MEWYNKPLTDEGRMLVLALIFAVCAIGIRITLAVAS